VGNIVELYKSHEFPEDTEESGKKRKKKKKRPKLIEEEKVEHSIYREAAVTWLVDLSDCLIEALTMVKLNEKAFGECKNSEELSTKLQELSLVIAGINLHVEAA
jgi:hypothetical protein